MKQSEWAEVEKKFEEIVNYYGLDGETDTPDFILAAIAVRALKAYDVVRKERESWFDG